MSKKLSYGPWMMFTFCSKCGENVSSSSIKCLACGAEKPFMEKAARRVYREPGFLNGLFGKYAEQVSIELKSK